MKLSLPIYTLDIIDSISFQKCLIPQEKFPRNTSPGLWAKCYFTESLSGRQYYAVAQIFPRDDLDGLCYLDTCVSNYEDNRYQKLLLDNLIVLENTKEIKAANVVFHLNPEYFITNSYSLTKHNLKMFAKILLKQYHLTHECHVRDGFLLDKGIDSICLEIEDNDGNCSYFTTDNTKLYIKNVCLKYNVFNFDRINLCVKPFCKARQELDDLMKILHMQRTTKKRALRMNVNAILIGAVGSGKSALVDQFLKDHHCNVFNINVTNCLKQYPGETETELRKVFKSALNFETRFNANGPTVILLEEIDLLCPQTNYTGGKNSQASSNYMRICAQLLTLVDDLVTSKNNIMCLATTSKPDNVNELLRRPGRLGNEIYITALQEEHRKDILEKLVQKHLTSCNISPAVLDIMTRQTQGYVLADLALLVRNVAQMIYSKSTLNVEDIIFDVLKKSKPISLKGTDVTAYKTIERFDSIGGMTKLKKILEVSILAGLKQRESFKRFGLSLPKGVLLYGPPGCAKTTIAKCLATEANMTFIATSGAEVYSPYVGSAEKFIMKIFQTARKNAPCLIFFDEIDSLVGRRGLTGSSNSGDVQTRILSTLLTEMDGIVSATCENSHIIVVAATNRPDMVDDALMRPGRFDKLIHVPAPDLLSRRSILEIYKRKMPFSKSIDLANLAAQTDNYSGADICNLCNEAAMQAFQRAINSEEIIMEDFENVLKTSKSSLIQSQIDWYYKFENKFL